jgi:hypothetical protein
LESDGRYKLLVIPKKEQVGPELHLPWDESGTWKEGSGGVRFRSAKGKVKRSARRLAASGFVIEIDGLRFEREEAGPNQRSEANAGKASVSTTTPGPGVAHP